VDVYVCECICVFVCVCMKGGYFYTYLYPDSFSQNGAHMTMSTKCRLAEPDLDCYRQDWLLRSGRLGEATTPQLCIAASNKVTWLLEVYYSLAVHRCKQQSGLATRGVWLVSEADPLHGEKESGHTLN